MAVVHVTDDSKTWKEEELWRPVTSVARALTASQNQKNLKNGAFNSLRTL